MPYETPANHRSREMKAFGFGPVTMVGYGGPFPRSSGNCFDLGSDETGHNHYYRIVNFCYENLEELFKRGIVDWPIEIQALDHRRAIIKDGRIPLEWYAKEYCSVCCPKHLIPKAQESARTSD